MATTTATMTTTMTMNGIINRDTVDIDDDDISNEMAQPYPMAAPPKATPPHYHYGGVALHSKKPHWTVHDDVNIMKIVVKDRHVRQESRHVGPMEMVSWVMPMIILLIMIGTWDSPLSRRRRTRWRTMSKVRPVTT
jgi:hypothetical protein